MPRLDAARVEAWRGLQSVVGEITRRIDDDLRSEWAVPLGWFDVLASLRTLGGRARPQDLAAEMRLPASSLSRRLDRLAEEGWIARHHHVDPADHRVVDIELTARGRVLWRAMNITYRRSLQDWFGRALSDGDVAALSTVIGLIEPDDGVRQRAN